MNLSNTEPPRKFIHSSAFPKNHSPVKFNLLIEQTRAAKVNAMYEGYWNLHSKPFPQRFAANSLHRSQSFVAASLRLKFCIDHGCGASVLLGTSGTGKTMLLKSLIAENSELAPVVHMIFPLLSPTEMLRLITCDINSEPDLNAVNDLHDDQLLRRIQLALKKHCDNGAHPVICFDDAHQLSDQVLQCVVQPLLNLCDADSSLQCSIILCGQPVLLSRLRKHAQLSDRIGVTATLQGFDVNETMQYVRNALHAAGSDSEVFTIDALKRLFEVTAGNPRRINRLCDMALLVGYAEQLNCIDVAEIEAISHELIPLAA